MKTKNILTQRKKNCVEWPNFSPSACATKIQKYMAFVYICEYYCAYIVIAAPFTSLSYPQCLEMHYRKPNDFDQHKTSSDNDYHRSLHRFQDILRRKFVNSDKNRVMMTYIFA